MVTRVMSKKLYVNLNAENMTEVGFSFLACQSLHPELYFSGADIDQTNEQMLSAIESLLQQFALQPIMHAPFFGLDPGARDPRIQALFQERLTWAISCAQRLGATQLVLHPGYGPWVPVRSFESWLKRAQPVLASVVAQAKEANLRLALENIYDADPNDLAMLLQIFPDDHIGICLDMGHFNLFSESGLRNWLEAFGTRLFEVHLHDNFGIEDDHIAVGDGTTKYGQLLVWLNSGTVEPLLTLEMPEKTHVIKSAKRVRSWFTQE